MRIVRSVQRWGQPWVWPLGLIVLISLWRLAMTAVLPVTLDESYYFDWARTLDWGYFDHPPGVALLGWGVRAQPGSVVAGRFGGWLAGTLTLLLLWRLFWRCGLRDEVHAPGSLTLALVLTSASLSGFVGGVLTTPDSALALGWVLALHEGLAALSGQRWRWLTTGAAVGFGLLGKYTMLLSGPVFLWAILSADARALRTRWPYLGALIALLVFSPNLVWNAQNDWLSLRFQFGHGFSTETGVFHLAAETKAESATGLAAVVAFAAVQLALLGVLVLPLLQALPRALAGKGAPAAAALLSAPARSLLIAAAAVPLLLFAVVASFSDVEPNWPGMALPAMAALLVVWLRPTPRAVMAAALANLLLLSAYVLHGATAALPLGDLHNRVLRETHGFAALARRVETLAGPVFADRYQLVAMLNFHQQRHRLGQWPGLARPSEYSRGRIAPLPDLAALEQSGFWLLGALAQLPEIPGFMATGSEIIADCAGAPLRSLCQWPAEPMDCRLPCASPLHLWHLARYQPRGAFSFGEDGVISIPK